MAWLRLNLNPLLIFEWDRRFCAPDQSENPTLERLLDFLCPLGTPSDMSAFKKRYVEISEKDGDLLLFPEEPGLKENVFGPLRQAKTNYVIGNYVGSIALCGIVAEKVAILIQAFRSSPNETVRDRSKPVFHAQRLGALKLAGHIDEESEKDFDNIKAARKWYLHYWNTPEEDIAKQAAEAYASAARLVLRVMDVEYSNGGVKLDPKLTEYLTAHGEIVFEEDDE